MLLSGLLITGTIEAGGDSVQAASSSIETLIYGLFQFQIVAWVASMLIGHIHSMEQISSYGLDPPIPPFSLIFIAADIVRGREDKLLPVAEKGAQFGFNTFLSTFHHCSAANQGLPRQAVASYSYYIADVLDVGGGPEHA